MRSNRCWDRSVSTIIIAIWIYTLAGLFGAVVELLDIHFNGVDHAHFTFFTEHENIKVIKSVGVIDGLKVCGTIVTIVGYYLFYLSAARLVDMQRSGRDGVAVQRIKSSYWQLMIAGILNLIPVFGNLMAHLLCIVAMLQQVRGYYTLSHSAVLSEVGRQGAKRLFVAALGMSLAAVIGLFSLYGNFIQATVGLSFLFVILSGWKMIGQGAYALTEEEVTEWNRRVCLSSETRYSVVVVLIFLLLERGWHILFCKFTLYDYGFHTVDLLSWVVSSLLVWNLLIFTNMRWNDWGRVGGGFFLFSLFADIVLYLSLDLFSGVDFETDFYVFYIHSVVDMLQSVQLCLVIAGTLLWGYCCMPIKNNKKSRLPLIE